MAYQLYSLAVGSTHLKPESSSADPGIEPLIDGAAGHIDNTVASYVGTRPVVSFTTKNVGSALAALGSGGIATGLKITTSNPVVLMFGKLSSIGTGGYEAGSSHATITVRNGILVVDSISGDSASEAVASFTLYATYDGINLPFVIATNTAISSPTVRSEQWKMWAAVVAYGTSSTLQIPITSATINTGIDISPAHTRAASSPHPTFAAVMSVRPTISVSTNAIKTVLDVIGVSNLVATAFRVYLASNEAGATTASGSVHMMIAVNDPLVIFEGIAPTHNQAVEANFMAYGTYDGTNEPIALSTSQALPAASNLSELYDCGPVMMSGTTFETQGWTFAPNNQLDHGGTSGEYRPTRAIVLRRGIEFGVTALDVNALAAFGEADTDVKLFLRKKDLGGATVADATEEHIEFSIPGAYIRPGAMSGSWGALAEGAYVVTPVYNGSDAVIAIDTGAAIA